MVSRQETTSNREAVSSLSRPTDARSSALTKQDGSAPNKTNNREGLGQILECKRRGTDLDDFLVVL